MRLGIAVVALPCRGEKPLSRTRCIWLRQRLLATTPWDGTPCTCCGRVSAN